MGGTPPTYHDITPHFKVLNPFPQAEEDEPYKDALLLDEQAVAIPFNCIGESIVLARLRRLLVDINRGGWARQGRRILLQ